MKQHLTNKHRTEVRVIIGQLKGKILLDQYLSPKTFNYLKNN